MPCIWKKNARTVTHECQKVNSGGYLLFIVQSERAEHFEIFRKSSRNIVKILKNVRKILVEFRNFCKSSGILKKMALNFVVVVLTGNTR